MKRSSLLLFAVLASAFASAEVTSSNTLCWITVNSPCTNVVISTALVDVGLPATNSVDVSNYVLTKGLATGDSLRRKVYVPGETEGKGRWKWEAWAVVDGAWSPVTVTDSITNQYQAVSDNGLALANAFILHRSNPSAETPIYLCGQVESSVDRTQTASQSVTVMANAGFTDVFIEAIPWDDGKGPASGDKIRFLTDNEGTGTIDYTWTKPSGAEYPCWCTNNVEWVGTPGTISYRKKETPVAVGTEKVSVPVGQGFYFTRKSIAGTAPSITWTVD